MGHGVCIWIRANSAGRVAKIGRILQVAQHGACLGLGLASLGSNDEEVFEEVKNILYTDSAVAGEAAGIALGLVCVGSASEKTQELLTYAHDTQHEKVRAQICAPGVCLRYFWTGSCCLHVPMTPRMKE